MWNIYCFVIFSKYNYVVMCFTIVLYLLGAEVRSVQRQIVPCEKKAVVYSIFQSHKYSFILFVHIHIHKILILHSLHYLTKRNY